MSYIGRSPQIGGYHKLDSITCDGSTAYTMQLDSANFTPESANHLIVSVNGVIQAPTTSYTISGSTITFASALSSSDTIDFIMALGNVLDIGVPSDSTVTNAKTNFVSTSSSAGLQIKGDGTTDGTLQLNCSQNSHGIKLRSPAHSAAASYTLTFPTTDGNADEFLKTDGSGALSWATAGGDNTPSFKATMSIAHGINNSTWEEVRFNTVSFDTDSAFTTGTYRFTVPSGEGGKYFFSTAISPDSTGASQLVRAGVAFYVNGSEVSKLMSNFNNNNNYYAGLNLSDILTLSAGDYVQVYGFAQDSSGGPVINDGNANAFSGFKLIGV